MLPSLRAGSSASSSDSFVSFVVKQFCTSARCTSFFSRPFVALTQDAAVARACSHQLSAYCIDLAGLLSSLITHHPSLRLILAFSASLLFARKCSCSFSSPFTIHHSPFTIYHSPFTHYALLFRDFARCTSFFCTSAGVLLLHPFSLGTYSKRQRAGKRGLRNSFR